MKKGTIIKTILFTAAILSPLSLAQSREDLSQKLKGKILLQVESDGRAWYVYPKDQKRYYLGRPSNAWKIMKELGQGITKKDLRKIPIGTLDNELPDTDGDGLSDALEEAISTDTGNQDSDGDGYNDREEVIQGYDPNGPGTMPLDLNFTEKHAGKIFLQVEDNGEAWYVEPENKKRYFLGSPGDALRIMRSLSLGIRNDDIFQIDKGSLDINNNPSDPSSSPQTDDSSSTCSVCDPSLSPAQVVEGAARAINNGKIKEAKKYFIPEVRDNIEYSLNTLDKEGRANLANIMRGTEKTSSTASTTVFSDKIFFDWVDQEVEVKFELEKRSEGWLLKSL